LLGVRIHFAFLQRLLFGAHFRCSVFGAHRVRCCKNQRLDVRSSGNLAPGHSVLRRFYNIWPLVVRSSFVRSLVVWRLVFKFVKKIIPSNFSMPYFTSILQNFWLTMFAKKSVLPKILINSYKYVKVYVTNICNFW
jgi:hypothetical protein